MSITKFGGWNSQVPHDKYPQKVASAIANLNKLLGFGCEYEAIAYLANQEVNGVNHAILVQQTVTIGKDTVNAAYVVLHEKPGVTDLALVDVHRVAEGGGPLGGLKVEMSLTLPTEAQATYNAIYGGATGINVEPIAYVGSSVTKGTNYTFVANVNRVVQNPVIELALVTINALEKKPVYERFFEAGSVEAKNAALGYAFTW